MTFEAVKVDLRLICASSYKNMEAISLLLVLVFGCLYTRNKFLGSYFLMLFLWGFTVFHN